MSARRSVQLLAFAVAGARLWNSLPPDIIASDTLSRFRRELKTFYLDSHIHVFSFSCLCSPCGFYLGHVKHFSCNVM